jgi:hypothetical protein
MKFDNYYNHVLRESDEASKIKAKIKELEDYLADPRYELGDQEIIIMNDISKLKRKLKHIQ